MSILLQSSKLIIEQSQENTKQICILKAIEQYEDNQDSEPENEKAPSQQEISHKGFEHKKSLQIKPLNMFKDTITLKKENLEKRQQVRNLQRLNDQLRTQYLLSINNNKKLQTFLREVEFTFQQDHKKTKTSDVILRARKTLFQEAKQANEKLKKMFKNNEASTIQELKVYIFTLEAEKEKLKSIVSSKRALVLRRMKEQDFNNAQIKQFEEAFNKIKDSLNLIFQRMNRRREQYKIERMEIKRMIKIRSLQAKKASIKAQNSKVKALSEQNEGLQFQIQLLRHRVKDRKKQYAEYQNLKQRIQLKHATIIQLDKQLREKNKTFDYMVQWTKELRKQLEERKIDHARKKAQFEDQINSLSEKYERYNQIYKTGLFQQQVARRKGPRDPQPQIEVKNTSVGKQVTLLEIKQTVKSLSFQLLKRRANIDQFIEMLVKTPAPQMPKKQLNRRVKLKSALSIESFSTKQNISVSQLLQNIKKAGPEIDSQMASKIARFVTEDGVGKAEEQANVTTVVAKQILKKLLERQLQSTQDMLQAARQLKKLLSTQAEGIRYQLKLAGGKEEQINTETVKEIFLRYGAAPYHSNLFTELLQLYGWCKRKSTCSIKLQDFDQISARIKAEGENCVLSLLA